MNVKELIEKLQTFDENLLVRSLTDVKLTVRGEDSHSFSIDEEGKEVDTITEAPLAEVICYFN